MQMSGETGERQRGHKRGDPEQPETERDAGWGDGGMQRCRHRDPEAGAPERGRGGRKEKQKQDRHQEADAEREAETDRQMEDEGQCTH